MAELFGALAGRGRRTRRQSSRGKTRDYLEIIAAMAVVASLIFVGYELRLNRSVATSEFFSQAGELEQGLRVMIAENSTAWRKGCPGMELTDDERVTFTSTLWAFNSNYFFVWRRARTGITDVNPDEFAKVVARSMYHFPNFREAWRKLETNGAAFGRQPRDWARTVEDQYQKFESLSMQDEPGVEWCGI